MELAYAVFGVNEFAARFFQALLLVRHRDALALALLGGGMTCFLLLVVGVLLPNLERHKVSKPLAGDSLRFGESGS